MSIIDAEDIAMMRDKKEEIESLLRQWDVLITKVSYMEIRLYNLREELFQQEQHLIDTVDFKELYGKNNADVRRKHLKQVLGEQYDEVLTTELKLNECKRRIHFISESIRCKRELLNYGEI